MKSTTMLLAGALSLVIVACSENELSPSATVTLKAATSITGTTGSSPGGRYMASVQLTDFKINMKEFEFEIDDEKEEKTTYKDFKLKGPFEIDLLNETTPLAEVLGITEIPNGRYEDIEFKIGKSAVSGSSMYGKSIYAAGTIEGKSFVFWHDVDEDFEVDFADTNSDMVINEEDITLQINFNLGLVFDSTIGIDLSSAKDTDGDGIIEIDPKGEDDNKALAHSIKELIKDLADLSEKKD